LGRFNTGPRARKWVGRKGRKAAGRGPPGGYRDKRDKDARHERFGGVRDQIDTDRSGSKTGFAGGDFVRLKSQRPQRYGSRNYLTTPRMGRWGIGARIYHGAALASGGMGSRNPGGAG
jgi:hypothetical protein